MITLFTALLVIDQATKYWALGNARALGLVLSQNYGIAFGLFQSHTLLIILLNVAFLLALWFCRKQYFSASKWLEIGLLFVLAGGASNCLDRIFRGYVVDFLQWGPIPTFNMADIWVNLGVMLFIIHYLLNARHKNT